MSNQEEAKKEKALVSRDVAGHGYHIKNLHAMDFFGRLGKPIMHSFSE